MDYGLEVEVTRQVFVKESGEEMVVGYYVMADTMLDERSGVELQNYGIAVSVIGGAEETRIHGVTLSGDKAVTLAEMLGRNAVTPCAARDVIEDWLLD